jgi:hypothetical protein
VVNPIAAGTSTSSSVSMVAASTCSKLLRPVSPSYNVKSSTPSSSAEPVLVLVPLALVPLLDGTNMGVLVLGRVLDGTKVGSEGYAEGRYQ